MASLARSIENCLYRNVHQPIEECLIATLVPSEGQAPVGCLTVCLPANELQALALRRWSADGRKKERMLRKWAAYAEKEREWKRKLDATLHSPAKRTPPAVPIGGRKAKAKKDTTIFKLAGDIIEFTKFPKQPVPPPAAAMAGASPAAAPAQAVATEPVASDGVVHSPTAGRRSGNVTPTSKALSRQATGTALDQSPPATRGAAGNDGAADGGLAAGADAGSGAGTGTGTGGGGASGQVASAPTRIYPGVFSVGGRVLTPCSLPDGAVPTVIKVGVPISVTGVTWKDPTKYFAIEDPMDPEGEPIYFRNEPKSHAPPKPKGTRAELDAWRGEMPDHQSQLVETVAFAQNETRARLISNIKAAKARSPLALLSRYVANWRTTARKVRVQKAKIDYVVSHMRTLTPDMRLKRLGMESFGARSPCWVPLPGGDPAVILDRDAFWARSLRHRAREAIHGDPLLSKGTFRFAVRVSGVHLGMVVGVCDASDPNAASPSDARAWGLHLTHGALYTKK